jgi:hypothetical protein
MGFFFQNFSQILMDNHKQVTIFILYFKT